MRHFPGRICNFLTWTRQIHSELVNMQFSKMNVQFFRLFKLILLLGLGYVHDTNYIYSVSC